MGVGEGVGVEVAVGTGVEVGLEVGAREGSAIKEVFKISAALPCVLVRCSGEESPPKAISVVAAAEMRVETTRKIISIKFTFRLLYNNL